MNFASLKTELSARGFDYLSDTRLGQYVNWARAELDDMELWPYREKSVTGDPPLAVSDLGVIEHVLNMTQLGSPIDQAEYGELVQMFGDLSTTGSPMFFYRATPSGSPMVATYPETSDTIGVQYWRVTPDLVNSGDTPAAPSRFHKLIVDMAVREAYRDADNPQAAEALEAQIERDLARMRQALLTDQVQGPRFIRIIYGSEDS